MMRVEPDPDEVLEHPAGSEDYWTSWTGDQA